MCVPPVVNGLVKAFDDSKRLCAHLWRDTEMKHLFRVLFCLALACGVASHARAQDFHVQVLDPMNMCVTDPAFCTIVDPTMNFTVAFSQDACGQVPIGDLPPEGTPYGCLVIANATTENFTSLSMTVDGPSSTTFDCPTDISGSIFSSSQCSQDDPPTDSTYNLFFSGGAGLPPTDEMIVFETGLLPTSLAGTGSVNTPEPDSVLLMVTGTLMAGLYLSRKPLAVAFGRAK
jgi:hypothetical protein